MKKWTALMNCLAVALLLAASPANALDLTPNPVVAGVYSNGHYYFQATGKRVGFRLDADTEVSGNSGEADFRFKDVVSAAMKIVKSPLTPEIGFDGQGLPRYRQAAQGNVPQGATEVALTEENPEVVPINEWHSHQYVFAYNFYGVAYRESVTFLCYSAKEQLMIVVTARPNDYARIYRRSYLVLNSFYEILPGDEQQKGT
jgi:hypothetical protein